MDMTSVDVFPGSRFRPVATFVILPPMHTDAFFWQLLRQLPETLFALLDLPTAQAELYRFEAVELKKSYRLDGLFVPKQGDLPLYFVEVQFRREHRFYANLFAKVFSYLNAHDPDQDWRAVAIFPRRAAELKPQPGYQELVAGLRVRRIYLDELAISDESAVGLRLIHLVTAPEDRAPELVKQLVRGTRRETNRERAARVIELAEEVLLRRFTELDREEIRRMFQLDDIRKSRVWQEAHEEGREEERKLQKRVMAQRCLAKGMSLKEIAELLEVPLREVRRLTRG